MAEHDNGDNSFSEYRRLLLSEIERLDKDSKASRDRIEALERDNVALKIKASLLGFAAGLTPELAKLLYGLSKP